MDIISGNKNPPVFPLPVCAHAIKSLLANPIGMENFWTGVGLLKCDRVTLSIKDLGIVSGKNSKIGSGGEFPLRSTGISSNYFNNNKRKLIILYQN